MHQAASVSHTRPPLNHRAAPSSDHSESSSVRSSSSIVSGRDELQPLPVITRQLKDRWVEMTTCEHYYVRTIFNKIAVQATPQMAADKE